MIRYAKTDDAAEICKIYNHYVLGTTITFEEEPVSTDEMAQRVTLHSNHGFYSEPSAYCTQIADFEACLYSNRGRSAGGLEPESVS
jgi:hypothetical protein